MFRGRAIRVSLAGQTCFAAAFSPKQQRNVFRWSDHTPRGAGEDRVTARTSVLVMARTVARFLHTQHSPWPAPGAVPILDMIELRYPGAYLLLPAWWFLDPPATAATLAALMSAGPRGRRPSPRPRQACPLYGAASGENAGRGPGGPSLEQICDCHQPSSVETAPRNVVRPRPHQRSSPLEQVGSHIGRVDPVRVDMGEHQFADLSRRVRALRVPITEAAAESAYDRWNALLTEQLLECVAGQRPSRDARKDQVGAVAPLTGFGQD